MAKKTFTDSPAMQFISEPTPAPELTDRPAPPAIRDAAGAAGVSFDTLPELDTRPHTSRGFIQVKKPLTPRAKEGDEPRSRRMQLLFKPSVFEAIRHIANRRRISFNHMVEAILTAYLEQCRAAEAQEQTAEDADKR